MGLFDFLLFWRKKPKKESIKVEKEEKEEVLEKQEAVAPEPETVEKQPVQETVEVETPVEKNETEEETSVPTAHDEDVYLVKTHEAGGWQVIKENAQRATRKFDTQSECIEYCKQNESYLEEILNKYTKDFPEYLHEELLENIEKTITKAVITTT